MRFSRRLIRGRLLRLRFRIRIYINKSHLTTNLLVYTGLNWNSLERALRLNVPEHSTNIEIAKLGQKHITSLLSGKTRKKTRDTSSNRKRIGRYIT